MEAKEIELNGRKYKAYLSPDMPTGAAVIIGPPEGLVDQFPELNDEMKTKLHNILYQRGLLSFKEASKPHAMFGVLQELFSMDAQKIVEAYNNVQKEVTL